MKVTLPAGKYFVRNPCYVYPEDKWDEYYSKIGGDGGVLTIDGHQMCAFSTKCGDGCYADYELNDYPVDSGLIGATPYTVGDGQSGDYLVVEFKEDFECSSDDGLLKLGLISIDTDDEDDEICEECGYDFDNCVCEFEDDEDESW